MLCICAFLRISGSIELDKSGKTPRYHNNQRYCVQRKHHLMSSLSEWNPSPEGDVLSNQIRPFITFCFVCAQRISRRIMRILRMCCTTRQFFDTAHSHVSFFSTFYLFIYLLRIWKIHKHGKDHRNFAKPLTVTTIYLTGISIDSIRQRYHLVNWLIINIALQALIRRR